MLNGFNTGLASNEQVERRLLVLPLSCAQKRAQEPGILADSAKVDRSIGSLGLNLQRSNHLTSRIRLRLRRLLR